MIRKIVSYLVLVLLVFSITPNLVYAASGDLDVTFGQSGEVITNFPGVQNAYTNRVKIAADGKILVAGNTVVNTAKGVLMRYNPDGSIDNTFGNNGSAKYQQSLPYVTMDICLQPDGKIVTAGYTGVGVSPLGFFEVNRFQPDGSPDLSFGTLGSTITSFGPNYAAYGTSCDIQSNGNIIVAGFASKNADADIAIAQYTSTGQLDPTFGTLGTMVVANPGSSDVAARVQYYASKIYISGWIGNDALIMRLNANGSADDTFGQGGQSTFSGGTLSGEFRDFTIQSNGEIIVTGNIVDNINGQTKTMLLTKYNTDGTLDNTFGVDGMTKEGFTTDNAYTYGSAVQLDGKIVLAGSIDNMWALARFTANGQLDTAFGDGGYIKTSFSGYSSFASSAYSLAIQQDGKIVIGGNLPASTEPVIAIARYLP